MPVEQLKKIADEADMIVAGYAFTKNAEGLIQVLNLSNPEEACVQMELLGHNFFVFLNADTDEVNVVYKRKGNTYGLIEPMFD